MPHGKVHYEIFVRKPLVGSGWKLVDALHQRDAAIEVAGVLFAEGGLKGVRVVKETLDPDTGEYMSLVVHEVGDGGAVTGASASSDEAVLPCFCPQDLYSSHARATIARLLSDYLGRQCMTVTELLHRADALETLAATGTIVQHAIQKIAVAHAGATGQSIHDTVRKLNDLVSRATERVYKDARSGTLPEIGEDGLAGAYDSVAYSDEPDYLLCSSVAAHLAALKSWGEKLRAVLALMPTLPDEGLGREICLRIIDRFVCDMVAGRAALQDLMGMHGSLGALLCSMTDLFLGAVDQEDPEITTGVKALSVEFAKGKLPGARGAIGQRILTELRGPRRLEPDCLETEVETVRGLAGRMVVGQGKFLTIDDITEAFATRSRRLLASDIIEPYLEALPDQPTRIRKLLALEPNLVGQDNKRSLASILLPQITAHGTERHYLTAKINPVVKLREIAAFQAQVLSSDFPDTNRRQLAEALDILACDVEARVQVIEGICKRDVAAEEKVLALLRLVTGTVFTQGEMLRRAKLSAVRLIREPQFMKRLAQSAMMEDKVKVRLKEMRDLIDLAELHKLSEAA
ncbi:MAG: hypothetical protein ACFB6R_14605 [Alphaproteobacteria bacterium]